MNIAHIASTVARTLRRTGKKTENVLGEDQLQFRRGNGTRDVTGMLKIISERTLEIDEESCACFIDWQKAFDSKNWSKLMQIPRGNVIDWREI